MIRNALLALILLPATCLAGIDSFTIPASNVPSLNVANGTFTVTGGVIDAPSQPFISLSSPTNNAITTAAFSPVFWVNVDTRTAMGFDAVNSSDTVTVPVAGRYVVVCQLYTTAATTSLSADIRVNGVTKAEINTDPISGSNSTATVTKVLSLAAGSTISCRANDTGGGYLKTGEHQSFFQVYKL